MLAYAFGVLNEAGYLSIAEEEFEYIYDLLASILAKGIAIQIKRGLGKEYKIHSESLSSSIGKIDISSSLKQQTILKKQLVCDFDVYTENSYMNQILKTTAMLLIRSTEVNARQKKELKKVMLYFTNVDEIIPNKIKWSSIKYQRNNSTYKMLINICYLIINGLLLTETNGSRKLARYLDDQRIHNLYQRFVFEYYRKHFPEYKVTAAQIDWDVDDNITDFLPAMKTDITIEHKGKILIIDTKYYSHTMQTNSLYNSCTIHSGNLYQIFTYVKNLDTTNSGNVSGILLYAKTDEEITPDNDYMMSGNCISVKTLDLNTDFSNIKKQLNFLVEKVFNIT
ncbi:5-methylcytosine-specific restriction enzyme subunit McrC [Ruminiclostridium sufflavum DSM 19573]|uniref:5-methylcytosine-specific restriction enzyme subunit McrC n=2 Tax=Ruminiclostridium TaxID=1508657 RepID=A0A318XIG7_9FIRM|nr:5-methylcytosine-specific restriction enzyme subunit McrC [Ruminiclostridium sufflavum DSM 19573]